MAHKFDKNNRNKLDNEKRRQVMPPLKTLEILGYNGLTDMADIGCGIGYFSIPAAELGAASSMIYAMDISVEMLNEVEKRAEEKGLSNIRTIQVDEYNLKLEDQSVGFAIMINVLHEIDDKNRYICEIYRLLQSEGKLAIIEWKKIDGESGPPAAHRISYEEVEKILSENGFENITKISSWKDFYGITAMKR